jgi:hypothetical protein
MPAPFRISVRSRPVVPWELLSSSLARTPCTFRSSLLLEAVVLGSLVQTAAGHDLPDARERFSVRSRPVVPWELLSSSLVRTPCTFRSSLLLEAVVLGSLVQTAAGHDLPDARERFPVRARPVVPWELLSSSLIGAPTVPRSSGDGNCSVLSVRPKCCPSREKCQPRSSRHQPTKILSIAATRKIRPKITAGNVI